MTKKPDWESIQNEYITGDVGYRPLAAEHGVPFSTLKRRAVMGHWSAQKENYHTEVRRLTQHKAAMQEASDCAEQIMALRRSSDNMTYIIGDMLQKTADAKARVNGIIATSHDERDAMISADQVRKLTGALKDLSGVVRDLYDLPGMVARSAMDVAARRLELESTKAAVEAGEGVMTVVFDPAAQEAAK